MKAALCGPGPFLGPAFEHSCVGEQAFDTGDLGDTSFISITRALYVLPGTHMCYMCTRAYMSRRCACAQRQAVV